MKKVLLAVDGSDASLRAARHVGEILAGRAGFESTQSALKSRQLPRRGPTFSTSRSSCSSAVSRSADAASADAASAASIPARVFAGALFFATGFFAVAAGPLAGGFRAAFFFFEITAMRIPQSRPCRAVEPPRAGFQSIARIASWMPSPRTRSSMRSTSSTAVNGPTLTR